MAESASQTHLQNDEGHGIPRYEFSGVAEGGGMTFNR